MMKRARVIFSIVFIILSIIIYFNVSKINSHMDIDSKAYVERGLKFAKTNSLIESDLSHPPYFVVGYPFFIGLIYKVFGFNNFYIILIQIILALFSGFLIFKITNMLFGTFAAKTSFIFFSLNLGYLTFSQFVLTEVLLSFFYVLFFFYFSNFFLSYKNGYLAASVFILGLSVLVKPAALYFIFPLLFLIFLFKKFTHNAIKPALLALFCFSLPIISYMSFNKITYGQFTVSALDIENMFFWYYPNVLAEKNKTNSNVERTKLSKLVSGNKYVAKSWDVIKKKFFKDLIRNPFLFIYVGCKNVLKTFLGLYTTNLKVLITKTQGGQISYFNGQGDFLSKICQYLSAGTDSKIIFSVGLAELIWSLLRYILCFIALVYLLIKRKFNLFLIFAIFIFYFSLITGHDGCARFRMMFEFVLIILSAFGFNLVWNWRRKNEKSIFCNLGGWLWGKVVAFK